MASSSKPFAGAESGSPGWALEAGKRGSPGRAVQAGIRGKRFIETWAKPGNPASLSTGVYNTNTNSVCLHVCQV